MTWPHEPIKPCPFCGCSGDLRSLGGGIKQVVQCNSCGSSGPQMWDEANAVKIWNIRYEPQPQLPPKGGT